LTPCSAAHRDALRDTAEPVDSTAALAAVPAFREVEVGGPPGLPSRISSGAARVRIAGWNLERCLYPEEAARILARAGAEVTLLTEMDIGMLRTGQVHTIGCLAAALGQRYAYALEFLELADQPPPPDFPLHGDRNTEGFHGNGFVSALPFVGPIVIPLDPVTDWLAPPPGSNRKLGRRMGIAATFNASGVPFVACSTHLEYRCPGEGRARQMRTLLDALDAYAGSRPVLMAGDLNTPVEAGRHDDPGEGLFTEAEARGYDWSRCNARRPTTRTSVWTQMKGTRQLDWFCTRGLIAHDPVVLPAIGEAGEVLSDHELIGVTIDLPRPP